MLAEKLSGSLYWWVELCYPYIESATALSDYFQKLYAHIEGTQYSRELKNEEGQLLHVNYLLTGNSIRAAPAALDFVLSIRSSRF